jgi:hypothetical protein
MHHKEDSDAARESDCLPALLPILDSIQLAEGMRIIERELCCVEADAMLGKIASALFSRPIRISCV